MMEIKQVSSNYDDLFKIFLNFCTKSKPYDFCQLKSHSLRILKIKEYFNQLINDCIVYSCYEADNWVGFVFLAKHDDHFTVEFIFGNNQYNSTLLIKNFHNILKLAQETFGVFCAKSKMQRKYKKREYLRWIKKYDKKCEIIEDPVNIEYTQIIWTYERLS